MTFEPSFELGIVLEPVIGRLIDLSSRNALMSVDSPTTGANAHRLMTILVIGGGPNQRPTRFYSGSGGDPKTLVFQRITPEKEKAKQNAEPELPGLVDLM